MNPNEEEIRIPKDLTDRLEDALCAAILSEQGMQCLKEERRRRVPRWLWGAVPAVALASLAAVLFLGHPKDTRADPAQAYAETERAFVAFSEALQTGFDAINTSFDTFDRSF